MAKKTKPRKKKFVGLLTNHTDRRDNETVEVKAIDFLEAHELLKAKVDRSRFSLRAVLTAKEARQNWA